MLKHSELQDAMQRHNNEKERIENEMFQFGDKLNEIMLDKERKDIEKQQLEIMEEIDEESEGRIIELEEEIHQIIMEIANIT